MYKSIYRKYRPITFEDLIGQDHVTKVLENQIMTGTISHAYLFSGTRGTGKTSAAKIFARAVNCLSDGKKPCNICKNCKESLDESAIDIIEIDAASNNGVDNIRDLKDRAFYQPTSLKYKVYIIDEVHMLSKGAFNALLKILEEPPEHLIFILATTEPERIPLTILSRCQKFQFKRINPKLIEKSLSDISEKEGVSIDEKALKLVVSNSDGSMRDAQSILELLLTSGKKNIDYEFATKILGVADDEELFELVDFIIDKSTEKLMQKIDDLISSGKDTEKLFKDILNHYRNLMLAKVSKNSIGNYIYLNGDKYVEQAEKISLNEIMNDIEILIGEMNDLKYSEQKRVILEITLLKLVGNNVNEDRFSSNVNKKEKSDIIKNYNNQKNDDIQNKHKSEKKEEEVYQNIESASEEKSSDNEKLKNDKKLDLSDIRNDWNEILAKIKSSNKKYVYAFVVESTLVSFENDTLMLGFSKKFNFHRENLMRPENREFLEKTISMFYNMNIKIDSEFVDIEKKDPVETDIETLTNLVGRDNIEIY